MKKNPISLNSRSRSYSILHGIVFHPITIFILFSFIIFIMFNMVKMVNGDDLEYSNIHYQYTLLEFLINSYKTWSGRLFNETLLYFFTGTLESCWKWISTISLLVCAYEIYSYLIYSKKMNFEERGIFAYLSCFSIFLINSSILSPSIFWVTGSLVYLVDFTFALIALKPFMKVLQNENYNPKKADYLYLIPSLFISMGQEQVGLCFLGFSLIILIYLIIKRRATPKLLWYSFISSLILQIIARTAPGTAVRYASEVNSWFPEFSNLDLIYRLSTSSFFLFNTIINQWYLVLILLWIILATLLRRNNIDILSKVISLLLYLYSFIMCLKFFKIPNPQITDNITVFLEKIFTFHFINPSTSQSILYYIPYVFWAIGILLIPISIFLIFKKTKQSIFFISLFLAAIASISLMVFSPTLFISGGRTSFVSNMLLIILILFLLQYNKLYKSFALPIIFLGLCNIGALYLTWQSRGFKIFMGNLDISEIPFIVRGQ